jgi:hypothetical protein
VQGRVPSVSLSPLTCGDPRLVVTVSRLVHFWGRYLLSRRRAILREPPPSTSGLGHGPFKAVARVRIPSGASPPKVRPLRGHDDFRRLLYFGERS